jgi:hypothetical protein
VLDAVGLVDRLLVSTPGTAVEPGRTASLTAADRDRLLCAVYSQAYGPRVLSSVCCAGCGKQYDLDFLLSELEQQVQAGTNGSRIERRPDGTFRLDTGLRFRLPTGEDEFAVLGMAREDAEQALLKRCVLEGDPSEAQDPLQRAMCDLAPLVDTELDATCPECGRQNTVHFDIQRFLLASLTQERRQLVGEVHELSRAYGWGLAEILDLPRSIRRAYVAAVESGEL